MITFKKGDKVLAKLKGYPPWPATVTEVNGKKINVVFYGTGEIGTVRIEDVQYYLKNKSKCNKFKSRKSYAEAIKQIEEAIQKDGGDGDSPDEDLSTKNKSQTLKRKKSSSGTNSNAKKTAKPEVPHVSAENDVDDISEDKLESKVDDIEIGDSNNKMDNNKKTDENEEDMEIIENESSKNSNANDNLTAESTNADDENKEDENIVLTPEPNTKAIEVDYKCFSEEYLKNILSYAEHVKKDESTYKNMKPEPRQDDAYDVLPAFQKKTVMFIKLHPDWPIPDEYLSNEYVRTIYDEQCATDALATKNLIENGKIKEITSNVIKSKLEQEQVEDYFSNKELDQKIDMLNRLKIEKQLVCIDTSIKGSLGLEKAETKEALKALNELKTIPFDELMLKKHPHIVDMVRRLRKYVGNTEEWKLGENELKEFNKDAKIIRELSEIIYENMKASLKMDDITDNNEFWDKFSKLVGQFELKCKDMTEAEIYVLCYEPYSRLYFLYQNLNKEHFLDMDKNLNSNKENETAS